MKKDIHPKYYSKAKVQYACGNWGWGKTPAWYTDINSDKDIEYVLSVIKQGYQNAPDL